MNPVSVLIVCFPNIQFKIILPSALMTSFPTRNCLRIFCSSHSSYTPPPIPPGFNYPDNGRWAVYITKFVIAFQGSVLGPLKYGTSTYPMVQWVNVQKKIETPGNHN